MATGFLTWFSGEEDDAWVFAAHGVAGSALALWVERLELHEALDYGPFPSTLWSSFTAEGRRSA